MTPDPKPARRVRDRAAMAAVHAQRPACRLCGARPVSLHHLVSRGLGRGDDVPANLIPLCRDHHEKVHAHDRATLVALGDRIRPEEAAYVLDKMGVVSGREFLLRRYWYIERPAAGDDVGG